MNKDISKAVRISIKVESIDGIYSQLDNWFVPNVVAEELLCHLVDHENRWSGSIKEIKTYLDSLKELQEYFQNKKTESIKK